MPGGGVFAVDDEGVVDSPGVNHGSSNRNAVDEAQASVGDIEVQSVAGQAQAVVNTHGYSRFKIIAGDRGVNNQSDLFLADTGLGDSLLSSLHRAVLKMHGRAPGAALANTGEALEQTLGHPQPLVGGR